MLAPCSIRAVVGCYLGLCLVQVFKKNLQAKAFQHSHKKKNTGSESSLSRNLADPLEKILQGSRVNTKQQEQAQGT